MKVMKSHSITGWRRNYGLFGMPDYVFLKQKIAVFVDGCFWHKCSQHCRMPEKNHQYWTDKIERNFQRDKQVTNELKKIGWVVIRIWEHELIGTASLSRKLNRLKTLLAVASEATIGQE